MMSLSIYYIDKASKILPNGKRMLKCVEIWTILSIFVYCIIGLEGFLSWDYHKSNTCTIQSFAYIRIFDLSSLIVLGTMYY